MSQEHTPLPWAWCKEKHGIEGDDFVVCQLGVDNSERRILIYAPTGNEEQNYANALLIIKAVKFHNRLLAMVERLEYWENVTNADQREARALIAEVKS